MLQRSAQSLAALAALLTTLGCASAPPAETMALPRCTAEVEGEDLTDWKQVAADGFTFCVPRTWRGTDHQWESGRSYVRWELGDVPPRPASGRARVTFERGSGPPAAGGGGSPAVGGSAELTAMIGGRPARLGRYAMIVEYETSVSFESPKVYFVGAARDLSGAGLEWVIYRTVRFPPTPTH